MSDDIQPEHNTDAVCDLPGGCVSIRVGGYQAGVPSHLVKQSSCVECGGPGRAYYICALCYHYQLRLPADKRQDLVLRCSSCGASQHGVEVWDLIGTWKGGKFVHADAS